jgi:polar amino acid transport system substrate-binding protein
LANAQSITDRVLEEGKITIGIHNQAPWGYAEGEGKAAGMGPDMIEAALGYPNCK